MENEISASASMHENSEEKRKSMKKMSRKMAKNQNIEMQKRCCLTTLMMIISYSAARIITRQRRAPRLKQHGAQHRYQRRGASAKRSKLMAL